jgi:antitoxin VapB
MGNENFRWRGRSYCGLCYMSLIYDRRFDHGKSENLLVRTIASGGTSQELSLPGQEVRIRRHGNAVILEPVAEDWTWLDSVVGKLDEYFLQAVNEQPEQHERPTLDELFR